MNEHEDRAGPITDAEVEGFYARQRRQILGRLEELPAGRLVRFPVRTRVGLGLAAAAALVLTFVAFQAPQPTDPGAGELVVGSIPDELASMPAGLSTFGVWPDDETEREPAAGEEMETLAWLMDDDGTGATGDAMPSFLEPFGTWGAEDEVDEDGMYEETT